MRTRSIATQARSHLDVRFKGLRPAHRFNPPVRGWIKAIREGLGMSSAQLARRLGIKQPSVVVIEQSEVKGTVQLDTLRRVAEALNCTLVYALVPNDSLEGMVRDRARLHARRQLESVEHSMLLENQSVPRRKSEQQLDAIARELSPRRLWDEP